MTTKLKLDLRERSPALYHAVRHVERKIETLEKTLTDEDHTRIFRDDFMIMLDLSSLDLMTEVALKYRLKKDVACARKNYLELLPRVRAVSGKYDLYNNFRDYLARLFEFAQRDESLTYVFNTYQHAFGGTQ